MSKFIDAYEAGIKARNLAELKAYTKRKAIEENPDPVLLEEAKKWVYSELPLEIRGFVMGDSYRGKGVPLYASYTSNVPDDYLWLVCKSIPELVIVEELCVADCYPEEAEAYFAYYVNIRMPYER